MSQALTLARPYARAAFGVARDQAAFVEWSHALTFASRASAETQVTSLINDPRLDADQAVALIAPDDASEAFRNFLHLLADNHRLHLLPEISGLYETLRAEAEGVIHAHIKSAMPLGHSDLNQLKSALSKRFGREVEAKVTIDESLIGGVAIEIGDTVIDGSLKGRLEQLQGALSS